VTRSDPLNSALPALSNEGLRQVLHDSFGIDDAELSLLAGERDQNVRVEAVGRSYLLKVANPADGLDVLDMQVGALRHIERSDPELPVMRVLPGEESVTLDDGRVCPVRLYTFLPGRAATAEELTPTALRDYGAVTARVGHALRGYFHPAGDYRTQWHLTQVPKLRDLLGHLGDPAVRAKAEGFLDRFDADIAPVLPGLRSQFIHADISRDNILVDEELRPTAIVDFGDMTHQPLVCDLAVAVCDVLSGRQDPVGEARALIEGYTSITPLEDAEAELLEDLVAARLITAVVVFAWRYGKRADVSYFDALQARRGELCTAALGLPYRSMPTPQLLNRRRTLLPRAPLFYDEPVHIVRGSGVWLHDSDGRRYLDCYNNVPAVGHAHPRVTAAVARQQRLLAVHSRYPHEALVELTSRILVTLPAEPYTVFVVNSGSEANDLAWRIACAATGNEGVAVTDFAYHGVTEATHRLSPEEWAPGEQHPLVRRVRVGDAATISGELAAMYLDPMCTAEGILAPPPEYLRAAAAAVRAAGGLFVADEVQAGHGRTGTSLWSYEPSGVVPDMITAGKAMGNGFPVAMLAVREGLLEAIPERTEIFSTFGGNAVACVAALAVLDVIADEELIANAARTGGYLIEELRRLDHPSIVDVRGRGLLIGVEFDAPGAARPIANELRRRGVLVGATGSANSVLKIRPPLVFQPEHADLLLEELAGALGLARLLGAEGADLG
jgi:4-aminobutyrate aminotransferase-like enzyme/Ser/Thr protein kinase RdoA (MazF antagonist)